MAEINFGHKSRLGIHFKLFAIMRIKEKEECLTKSQNGRYLSLAMMSVIKLLQTNLKRKSLWTGADFGYYS